MSKMFMKLSIGETIAVIGTRCFKKLTGGEKPALGRLFFTLFSHAKVEVDTPIPIKMDTSGSVETSAKPNTSDVVSGTHIITESSCNTTPQPAETVDRSGETKSILTAIAKPLSSLYVWCRGKLTMVLGTKGMPQPADTVDGSGETTTSLTEQATPTTQGMTTMLFSAKGELNTVVAHENAKTLEKAGLYASNNLAVCGRMGTWLEPVVVDGVLILRQAYSATVTDGILEVR